MKNTFLALAGLSLFVADASSRTWTSSDGRTIEADFVEFADNIVVVKRGGKTVKIPLDKLAEADRKWVMAKTEAAEADKPAAGSLDTEPITRILESMLKAKPEDAERESVEAFFMKLLPAKGADGEDLKWNVSIFGGGDDFPRESLLISAKVHSKADEEQQLMWFHILFYESKRDTFGSDKLGKYPAMRAKDAHCFVTVNRTEVRGVASADHYEDDEKIDAIMQAIDLETIEKL